MTALILNGVSVSPGIAAGRAHLWHPGESAVPRYRVPAAKIGLEIRRLDAALEKVRADLQALKARERGRPAALEIAAFIDLYLMLLADDPISQKPREAIRARGINAEHALKEQVDAIGEHFRRVDDDYLRGRGEDIVHVMNRVLAAMANKKTGGRDYRRDGRGRILIAADLNPADVVELHRRGFAAFATDGGGATSHAAILARSLGVPALAGLNEALFRVREDDRVIVDADSTALLIRPDAAATRKYAALRRDAAKRASQAAASKNAPRPAQSRDKVFVSLQANMELPDEIPAAQAAGANGVGLFRTEFLFLDRPDFPGEDEQFEIYRAVVRAMTPLPVVFRTLDLGADKGGVADSGANPALGLRAIRYCLAEPEMFLTQLRALLRASTEGNLRILLPMLSHPQEPREAAVLINKAREQLNDAGIKTAAAIPVGGMIEVPAAVFVMRALARCLDFFSIGTNDLMQYTLAIDRGEEKLADLYDPLHPAVLRLLADIVAQAGATNRPVTLCGEIAGDAKMTRLCLALGLRRLSMGAHQIAAVREAVAQSDIKKLTPAARRILRAESPEAARAALAALNTAG